MTHDNQLPRSIPEAHGVASSAVLTFVEAAEQQVQALHSVMLLRHGHVLAEGWWAPYAPDVPHMLFSVSKSFTASAIGLAVDEGRLAVDDSVLSFFPDDAPAAIGEHLAAMRVRDLLTMTTGHAEDTLDRLWRQPDGDWARAFLAAPVQHAPGTHFVYNSGASYMLSAIVQKLVGTTMLEYLEPRLFAPLGIVGATWETSPQGINTGGWGLSITTEDIARFGQLHLQRGMWHNARVLPEAWVDEATRWQVDNSNREETDWRQGYGYQFWRCRHGAYRGDGAFGQFCIVMPEQDAVLAITGGLTDMQAVLNLVWEHLLPAMQPAPLPEDRAAHATLTQKLGALMLPPQAGDAASPTAARVSGSTYRCDANELQIDAVTFAFDNAACTLTLQDAGGEQRIAVGSGAWAGGHASILGGMPEPIAASGAWASDDTFIVQLCHIATPFIDTITARFANDQLRLDVARNVSFGPTTWPQIVGRRRSYSGAQND